MHAVLGASLAAVIGISKPTLVDVDHDALDDHQAAVIDEQPRAR
jgi:hypothetical protein